MKNKNILTHNTENAAQKLLGLTLEINQVSTLYNVSFELFGITNIILISIIPNEDYEQMKTFTYSLDKSNKNEFSLEFLTKLLEEILKTNIKYKDLINESTYAFDAFLENELENASELQEVSNDK